jgi:chromosome segregation ATPase
LSAQNEKLREKLITKEKELADMRDKNSSLDHKLSTLAIECSSISTQKISDLSKSNRHLNSKLSSMKTRCRELEMKLLQLERINFEKDVELKEQKQKERPHEIAEPSVIQQLQDDLERTKRRLFESSNQNLQLKNELKMAHKCLQQELGSDANISQILNGTSNWRGRAQQISILQNKISELKEKFDSDFESFEAARIPPKRLESARRLEIESLNKELDDCKVELEDVRQRLTALKTRNKNLGDDLNNYKLKTLELMEKSKNDDSYIQCLNEKVSMTKYECNHKIEEMRKQIEQVQRNKEDSDFEVQKLQSQIENMNQIIEQKEKDISDLNSEKEDLENNLKNVTGDFLFSCRDLSKENYVEMMKTLEDEKTQLLSMMRDLNERCNRASLKENEQHDVIMKMKTKIARLESKIKDFENEKETRKDKHRRSIRISEYSRSMSGSTISRPASRMQENRVAAIDSLKLR